MNKLIIIVSFFLFFSCSFDKPFNDENKTSNSENGYVFYSIKKYVDGDTFWINDGSKKGLKIRLIGVDTPESQARFGRPEEYFGDEASDFTKSLLKGKKVRLEFDVDQTDSFGRTLAYVYLEDGTFLNAELVKQGYAMVMTVPPNIKYSDLFYKLQVKARENNKGLWKIN